MTEPLEWRVDFGAERPGHRMLVLAIAFGAAYIGLQLGGLLLSVIGFLVVFASTAELFLPLKYKLDESGAQVRCGISVTAVSWDNVKRLIPLRAKYASSGMATQALWTEDLTDQEAEALMAKLEEQIRKRKLEAPAIMFLEMNKPLTRITANAMIVFTPFLAPFVGLDNVHNYSRLLMDRDNVERLICRLEAEPVNPTPQEEPSP